MPETKLLVVVGFVEGEGGLVGWRHCSTSKKCKFVCNGACHKLMLGPNCATLTTWTQIGNKWCCNENSLLWPLALSCRLSTSCWITSHTSQSHSQTRPFNRIVYSTAVSLNSKSHFEGLGTKLITHTLISYLRPRSFQYACSHVGDSINTKCP